MGKLFQVKDKHLHPAACDAPFKRTYIGQAHISGSGPNRTCLTCKFFGKLKDGAVVHPGFYSRNDQERPNLIKEARCHAPIPGIAPANFPHSASACSLYQERDSSWPVVRPPKQ